MDSVVVATAAIGTLAILGMVGAMIWFFLFRQTGWKQAQVSNLSHRYCPACGSNYEEQLAVCWRSPHNRWCGMAQRDVTEEGEVI